LPTGSHPLTVWRVALIAGGQNMSQESSIRKAVAALQQALEARTVEFQIKHADEARRRYEQAVRSTEARLDAVERKPGQAARLIAMRAVDLEIDELKNLERRLCEVEERIAAVLCKGADARTHADERDCRRFRLAE